MTFATGGIYEGEPVSTMQELRDLWHAVTDLQTKMYRLENTSSSTTQDEQDLKLYLEELRLQMGEIEKLRATVKQLEAENQVLLTYHSEVHNILREHERFPEDEDHFGKLCNLTNDTLHRLGDIPREKEGESI